MVSADETTHFYEPRKGHGLAHDPFNSIVGPRPIGWISSHDGSGHNNLAPYSFFNAFNYVPPIIGFASIGYKDTVRNVERTREFTWNLATRPLAEKMNASSAIVAPDVDEFNLAGLRPVPAALVGAARVGESPVNFECRVTQILQRPGCGNRHHLASREFTRVRHGASARFTAERCVRKASGPLSSTFARIHVKKVSRSREMLSHAI